MRVIAGQAKGRRLVAPKHSPIRPTTDKVKSAIFSMLQAQAFRRAETHGDAGFPYQRVLDLFAGSGALGIEALSRGAGHVDFVETNPVARAALRRNLHTTGFEAQADVHALSAEAAVSTFRVPYDLILLDPPYDDPAIPTLIESLGHAAILGEGALVMLEHARSLVVPAHSGRLHLARTRHHGSTAISLYLATAPASELTEPQPRR